MNIKKIIKKSKTLISSHDKTIVPFKLKIHMKSLNQDFKAIAKTFSSSYSNHNYNFDYTERSIKQLDDLIEEKKKETNCSGPLDLSNEARAFLFQAGVYLGEVIKKKTKGTWTHTDEGIMLKLKSFIIQPVLKAFKRFYEGKEESVYGFYLAFTNEVILAEQIKNMGEIPTGTPIQINVLK